jgi:CRISPR-associated endonuclease Cas1
VSITQEDTERISELLPKIYDPEATGPVVIADGYGIQLKVHRHHLVISDGLGSHRRERKLPRADRTLKRVVILGQTGHVTLEALRWCHECGISVCVIDPAGELVSAFSPESRVAEASLLRRQALAGDSSKGVEIGREILSHKIMGQAQIVSDLLRVGQERVTLPDSCPIIRYVSRLETAPSIAQLNELEGWAARDYFATWRNVVVIPWPAKEYGHIPGTWLNYPGRVSRPGGRKEYATHPVNAMLNFAYTLGYAECRTACVAHGLDPKLGFFHADLRGRDSLALDVLEAVRPAIDRYILGLLGFGAKPRSFTHLDFSEPYGYPAGTCRLTAPLTHEISRQSYHWRALAGKTVSEVVNILTGSHGNRGSSMPGYWEDKRKFQDELVTTDDVLPVKQWETKFVSLVPPWPGKAYRPPISDRTIVAAILHMERSGRVWAHVPPSLGVSYRTMRERRRMWARSGHWPAIQEAIRKEARNV